MPGTNTIQLSQHPNGTDVVIELATMPLHLSRSETIQEIISHKPGFLEKWALWLFLLILFMLATATWFIKYPDVVFATATLTASNAPKEIIAKQDGKIIKLFVHNNDAVYAGQMIGWMESTASHQEVVALKKLLDSSLTLLSTNNTQNVSCLFNTGFNNLGELQPNYQQFTTAWQQFNDYLVNGYYFKKKQGLTQDMLTLKKMYVAIEQQNQLTLQDLQISQETFDANNYLFNEKVISKQEYRDNKEKLINKQMQSPQLALSLLNNESTQAAKQKDIDDLEHNISQQKTIFMQALQTLKSAVEDWERRYIITAAVSGRIAFLIPLQENQYLQGNKTIGYVNPPDSKFYAQVNLQQNNFGKISVGKKVQLRFDAYPYQEFGYVTGQLNYISSIPSDSGFLAEIQLPNGLITSSGKSIQYRNGLKSQALIITKNTRLLQRFFYSFRQLSDR